MVKLFKWFKRAKPASEVYRSILARQIESLTALEKLPLPYDQTWQAKRDYAIALARDVLKRVLPPDSTLYAMYANLVTPKPDTESQPPGLNINTYELELYRLALANIDWSSTDNEAGAFPSTNSVYSEIDRALPEMVYRHPAFEVILGLLFAVIGVAAFGVFKFYNITVDIGQQIRTQQEKLVANFESQKREIEAAIDKHQKDSAALSEQLSGLGLKLTDTRQQIAQLEVEAQGTLSRFTSQVGRNVEVEVDKAMDRARSVLDQRQQAAASKIDDYWTKEAQPVLKAAAEKRVDQILAEGGKPFRDKLQEFESRIVEAAKTQGALEDRQKTLEGKQLLLSKASSLLVHSSPDLVDRLSAYIGEAIWVIYGGAALMILFLITNVVLLIRKWLCCRNSHGDERPVILRCETQENQGKISSPQLGGV